ncbi:hypothetical protein JXL19_11680, partial [bacterium]|nr:hypothetical protein [bacterium]
NKPCCLFFILRGCNNGHEGLFLMSSINKTITYLNKAFLMPYSLLWGDLKLIKGGDYLITFWFKVSKSSSDFLPQ